MKKLKDLLPGIIVVALLAAVAFLWLSPGGLKTVPEVSLTTLDGDTINLAEKRGKPYLITFWATTCPGCVAEMPHLIELYKDLSPKGFDIIAVAMSYDPPNQVVAMRDAKQIPYPIALDITGELAKAFGDVRLTPTTFLVGNNGRILQQKLGELDMDAVRKQIMAQL